MSTPGTGTPKERNAFRRILFGRTAGDTLERRPDALVLGC